MVCGRKPPSLEMGEDVDGSRIKISRSINRIGETTTGKNENAQRVIGLSKYAANVLEAQRQILTSDYIFGELSQDNYYESWKRYCKANNINYVTPYELRHTFVSVAKQLPEGDVKTVVGHSQNMDTFGVYGHMMDGDLERIADEIGDVFATLI